MVRLANGDLGHSSYAEKRTFATGQLHVLAENISDVLQGPGCLGIPGAGPCLQVEDPWGEGTILVFGYPGERGADFWFLVKHDEGEEPHASDLSFSQISALRGGRASIAETVIKGLLKGLTTVTVTRLVPVAA